MDRRGTLICPKCGYDQSGQAAMWTHACPLRGVCAECGLGFRWADVIDPSRTGLPWYVEHASRWAEMVRRTPASLMGLLIPSVFWRRVSLERVVRPRRLWFWLLMLWVLQWLIAIPCLVGAHYVYWYQLYVDTKGLSARYPQSISDPDLIWERLTSPMFVIDSFWWAGTYLVSGLGDLNREFWPALPTLLGFAGVWALILAAVPTTRRIAKLRYAHVHRAMGLSLVPVIVLLALIQIGDAALLVRRSLALNGLGYGFLSVATDAMRVLVMCVFWGAVVWVHWLWISAIRTGWRIRPSWVLIVLGLVASLIGGLSAALYSTVY